MRIWNYLETENDNPIHKNEGYYKNPKSVTLTFRITSGNSATDNMIYNLNSSFWKKGEVKNPEFADFIYQEPKVRVINENKFVYQDYMPTTSYEGINPNDRNTDYFNYKTGKLLNIYYSISNLNPNKESANKTIGEILQSLVLNY